MINDVVVNTPQMITDVVKEDENIKKFDQTRSRTRSNTTHKSKS